jgi:hypothetical protein
MYENKTKSAFGAIWAEEKCFGECVYMDIEMHVELVWLNKNRVFVTKKGV